MLSASGLRTCGDVVRLPLDAVARRFGAGGRQLWLAAHGRDPAQVEHDIAPLTQATVSRVLLPRTVSVRTIEKVHPPPAVDKLAGGCAGSTCVPGASRSVCVLPGRGPTSNRHAGCRGRTRTAQR
ncbi:MAG: hypothetical protein MZV65_19035 [Chromatiales bacterium]|nr:hypothetical protein [Chromatiales bacterium]